MGQLESYTIQDIYSLAIVTGLLSSYFAEEIEATVESIVPYVYSQNITSKKKLKLLVPAAMTGDPVGAIHFTHQLLGLSKAHFLLVERPLEERFIWQDQFLASWGKKVDADSVHIEDSANWNA